MCMLETIEEDAGRHPVEKAIDDMLESLSRHELKELIKTYVDGTDLYEEAKERGYVGH